MAQVFRCDSCDVRTTNPYTWRDQTLCVDCMDSLRPRIVAARIEHDEHAWRRTAARTTYDPGPLGRRRRVVTD